MLPKYLIAIILLSISVTTVHAQDISAEKIIQAIVNDSGGTANPANFQRYARKLNKTLSQYSPEQLERIFTPTSPNPANSPPDVADPPPPGNSPPDDDPPGWENETRPRQPEEDKEEKDKKKGRKGSGKGKGKGKGDDDNRDNDGLDDDDDDDEERAERRQKMDAFADEMAALLEDVKRTRRLHQNSYQDTSPGSLTEKRGRLIADTAFDFGNSMNAARQRGEIALQYAQSILPDLEDDDAWKADLNQLQDNLAAATTNYDTYNAQVNYYAQSLYLYRNSPDDFDRIYRQAVTNENGRTDSGESIAATNYRIIELIREHTR